jgi:Na+-driven multidrug efflux pump
METLINIFFLFMDFLTWLLHQGTWGVIASLVIILTVKGLIVYAIWKFLKWFLKDAEPIFFR